MIERLLLPGCPLFGLRVVVVVGLGLLLPFCLLAPFQYFFVNVFCKVRLSKTAHVRVGCAGFNLRQLLLDISSFQYNKISRRSPPPRFGECECVAELYRVPILTRHTYDVAVVKEDANFAISNLCHRSGIASMNPKGRQISRQANSLFSVNERVPDLNGPFAQHPGAQACVMGQPV